MFYQCYEFLWYQKYNVKSNLIFQIFLSVIKREPHWFTGDLLFMCSYLSQLQHYKCCTLLGGAYLCNETFSHVSFIGAERPVFSFMKKERNC